MPYWNEHVHYISTSGLYIDNKYTSFLFNVVHDHRQLSTAFGSCPSMVNWVAIGAPVGLMQGYLRQDS